MNDFFSRLEDDLVAAARRERGVIGATERDLVVASRARLRRRRSRRLRVAMAAAAFLAIAVPAWATGLFGALPQHDRQRVIVPNQQGARYVLAVGRTASGRRYRLVGYRGSRGSICVLLELGARSREASSVTGSCADPARLPALPVARGGPAGTHVADARTGIIRPDVRLIELTLSGGRHLVVRPNRFDASLLRRAGLPVRVGYAAFIPPPGERVVGLTALTSGRRVLLREGAPTPTERAPRVVASPAL